MARRRALSQSDLAGLARQAIDRIRAAADPAAEAERVLAEAAGPRVRAAILALASGAADRVLGPVASAALHGSDPELSRSAAELLVGIGDPAMALKILEDCFRSSDPAVRGRAVEAIEALSAPEAVGFLPAALTDESDLVRRAATSTLSLIIGTSRHPLRAALLERLTRPDSPLNRAVVGNDDNQVRRQAAQSLAYVKSDAVVPVLAQMAGDEDDEVRQEVVLCLAAIGSGPTIELTGRMIDDPSYRVASSALDMLAGRLGAVSGAFLEHLKKALAHPSAELRRHAVLMLERYGPAVAEPLLQAAASDADFEVARRAGEILRRRQRSTGVDWLADEMDRQAAGERVLAVWEAGTIGSEAGLRVGLGAARDRGGTQDRLVPILEETVRNGAPSDRMHAISELAALVDIADSRVMREALRDDDPSVRSRAADTLQYTRDAELLVEIVRTHPDPSVRRGAIDALIANPGGPKRRGSLDARVTFAAARTLGMELFGHFLAAMNDPDEGVRQVACEAVREYAAEVGVLPVKAALEALSELADDEDVSVLVQEEATAAEEVVRRASAPPLIVSQLDEVLAWRGQVARDAHALLWDDEAGCFRIRPGAGAGLAERRAEGQALSPEQAAAVARAADTGAPLDRDTARALLRGLTRDLTAALNAAAYAAVALRVIGQEDWLTHAERWTAALAAGPKLQWGPRGRGARYATRIGRLRRRAWINLLWAREDAEPGACAQELAAAADDADAWVRLTALAVKASLAPDDRAPADALRTMARKHATDREFCEPVGLASLPLMRWEGPDAVPLAAGALAAARIDFRVELTQQIMAAVRHPQVAHGILAHLRARPLEGVAPVCLALALRGGGHALEGMTVMEPAEGADPEQVCASLALRAMEAEEEAAAQLTRLLRHGSPKERYLSGCYLGLARVRSAAMPLAGTRDQPDAPYLLRGLCAALLLPQGLPTAMAGWAKLLKGVTGRVKADMLTYLCRGVEDTILLMNYCADVDVGRFV